MGPKKLSGDLPQQRFAGRHVRTADEDGRVPQVLRAAREDGPVHEFAHALHLDPVVLQQLIHSRIDGHHRIEDARVPVAVELNQNLRLGHRLRIP